MAELTSRERLQPSLLDRLTDDRPRERDEPLADRIISRDELRAAVLRDLEDLLNTPSPDGDELPAQEFPLAAESVLAFGVPDLTGLNLSTGELEVYQRALLAAIRRFEPRIAASSLAIEPVVDEEAVDPAQGGRLVRYQIHGELWGQPIPDPLYIKTAVDLETGRFLVEGSGHG